ncbi:hypothetical protein [Azohydromonas lata]|uniref:Uncharacterized protein n=1 Tax=Azohydromonas lata TaxID=45677 RepID=A0ABU5ICY4_9BURK|nr:hypothetical protein [Azohydromonas lata]MDZ5456976.1 hypothetical protein [Azohydromonas lata]
MNVNPMTLTYHRGARIAGRATRAAAPLHLIGLVGQDGAERRIALQALQALGFQACSFASELQRQAGEAWCMDQRHLAPGECWEVPLQALAAARCADPFFRAWAARRGLDLDCARSPRWATMHWSLYKREADAWAFVRAVEAWLVDQHVRHGRDRLVITDVHTLQEYELLQHWGARTLELGLQRMEGPTGAHDAWVNTGDASHLAQRVATTVAELFGESAMGIGRYMNGGRA